MDPTEVLPTEPLHTAPAMQPSALVLGRYRLEQRLGAGGFGVVWRARDERLERPVAGKVIPHRKGMGKRAEREASLSRSPPPACASPPAPPPPPWRPPA